MRQCQFTKHISLYVGPVDRLWEHLDVCEACHTAGLLLATETPDLSHDPSPNCPDEVILKAYHADELPDNEHVDLGEHINGCGYCLHWLRRASQGSGGAEQAERALTSAHEEALVSAKAREMALSIAQTEYSVECSTVEELFDEFFSTSYRRVKSRQKHDSLAGAFAFAPEFPQTLSQRIVELSVLASYLCRIRAPSEVAEILTQNAQALEIHGLGHHLLFTVIQRVKDLESHGGKLGQDE